MKLKTLAPLALCPLAFMACGDDTTENITQVYQSGVEVVSSEKELPACDKEHDGNLAWVKGEAFQRICSDGKWLSMKGSADSVIVKDSLFLKGGCAAEALSDSSGFKIMCDGDSVGVVLNGKDGKPGIQGEEGVPGNDGEDGQGCEVTENTEELVTVKCGDDEFTINKPAAQQPAGDAEIYGVMKDIRDKKVYGTVKIGDQIWMAENLDYAYLNPTSSLDSSSFCYDNDAENCKTYGRLYLWSAAVDSAGIFSETSKGCGDETLCDAVDVNENVKIRGVCPQGWHLPSKAEYEALVEAVGGEEVAAKALKAREGWESDIDHIGNGTDDFGFAALPAGHRSYGSTFVYKGTYAIFWTSSRATPGLNHDPKTYAAHLYMDYFGRFVFVNEFKNEAQSVRCVKD